MDGRLRTLAVVVSTALGAVPAAACRASPPSRPPPAPSATTNRTTSAPPVRGTAPGVAAPAAPRSTAAAPRPTGGAGSDPTLVIAELARRGEGGDPTLAGLSELLAAAAKALSIEGDDVVVRRLPELEATERARAGLGTPWAVLTTFHVDASPEAVRRAYLDFDRLKEWTGHGGTAKVSEGPDGVVARTDAVRSFLGREFGARWRFLARTLDRGDARLLATSMLPHEETAHMLTTKGFMLALPERGGTRVVEASTSVVDFEVHDLLKGLIAAAANKEARLRVDGIRAHAHEYEAGAARSARTGGG